MSNKTFTLTDHLHRYLLSVSPDEPEILRRLREETARLPEHNMQIAPEQGMFMQLLLKLMQARNTIELGVFTGYSTLCVALALPDDGKVIACDRNKEWTDLANRYWMEAGVAQKIDLRLGNALATLDGLISEGNAGRFDFVFIDADKENYWNYVERSLVLLRVGGLIAVDNVLWSGKVADPAIDDRDTAAIRRFNKQLRADTRVQLSMVPIADGLTLAVKK
jgi:predicted O-methyltransferase YrrM